MKVLSYSRYQERPHRTGRISGDYFFIPDWNKILIRAVVGIGGTEEAVVYSVSEDGDLLMEAKSWADGNDPYKAKRSHSDCPTFSKFRTFDYDESRLNQLLACITQKKEAEQRISHGIEELLATPDQA